MCQGEGADVALESDKEDDETEGSNRKVKFKIYNVKSSISFSFSFHRRMIISIFNFLKISFSFFGCAERQTGRTVPDSGGSTNRYYGGEYFRQWNWHTVARATRSMQRAQQQRTMRTLHRRKLQNFTMFFVVNQPGGFPRIFNCARIRIYCFVPMLFKIKFYFSFRFQ